MGNLFRRLARRNALFFLAAVALLAAFEFVICAIVSTIDVGAALRTITQSIPPFLQPLLGDQFLGGLSTPGILAFGWNHPIVQALGSALAILLAARAVAGEIEQGTLELVLAQPLSRGRYLLGQILFAFASLLVLGLAGVVGTAIGQGSFALPVFSARDLARVCVNFVLLQAAWYGITLALSVYGREGGRVAAAGFLLAISSYLIQAVGRLWGRAAFLLPFSLHTYYSPQAVLVDRTLSTRSIVVLLAAAGSGIVLASWRFQRRDIP